MPGMDNSPLFDSFNFLTIRDGVEKVSKMKLWKDQASDRATTTGTPQR
jgi:hypothetical protein